MPKSSSSKLEKFASTLFKLGSDDSALVEMPMIMTRAGSAVSLFKLNILINGRYSSLVHILEKKFMPITESAIFSQQFDNDHQLSFCIMFSKLTTRILLQE